MISPSPSARRSGTSGGSTDGHQHRARSARRQPTSLAGKAAFEVDDRLIVAGPLRRTLNKVFPDHWSFLLGEIALYSFIVLLLSGTYLTFFFDASMKEVVYAGSYAPLRGVSMSAAYDSTLNMVFDVRGALMIRQMHHWAALLFVASICVHLLRIFFTGAFRRPRETNWFIGIVLLTLALLEGFAGYTLPDDLLSGTGLRIFSAVFLSIPVIGTWIYFTVFGGDFPGELIIGRLYIIHVLIIPAVLLALIALHLLILVKQKHTQFPGPGRTEHNVVGNRLFPTFAGKATALLFIVFGLCAALGGLVQINPIWLFGPYNPAQVSAGSQPDWYIGFIDGGARIFPPWEIVLWGYHIPPVLWGALGIPGLMFGALALYPILERVLTKDTASHHLLQRPRDVPVRTALGAMGLTAYVRAVDLRWQRPHRRQVRPEPQRDDLVRPDRRPGPAPRRLLGHLPALHRPGAARPRGARARHRDRCHPPAAQR